LENPIPPQNEQSARPRSGMISLILALAGAAFFVVSLMVDAPGLSVIAFLLLLVALIYGGRSLFKREARIHRAWEWLGFLFELLLIGAVVISSLDVLVYALIWIVGAAVLAALVYVCGSFFA